ncbi:MAG: LPXTG cell wall anchor domain-containing protein [Mogibacterium sp.]|nr:LPXTG cell wall anchor domain-containing protein [Mogibacterium sp.]
MNKPKRMLAILLSLAMMLSMTIAMSATAFAADPAYDSPIKVTGLAKDDVAHFYKIVEWVGDGTDNVGGWKAIAPFDTVLDKDTLKAVLIGDPDADPKVPPTLITSELAGQLAKVAKTLPATYTQGFDVTVGQNGEAVVETAAKGAGIYMALVTPADADTVYNPVFVSSDYNKDKSGDWAVDEAKTYSDEAAAKKNSIPLTKTASVDTDDYDGNWETTAIGETVHFKVTTAIPGYGKVYTAPVFNVTDSLTDLTLKTNTVTVTKPANAVKDTDYTITATTSGYKVEFKASYLKTIDTPTEVEITYDAIVSTTAPKHVNTEKNTVSTEFSHNPSDESDHGFKKDTTQHYTFTIDADILGGYNGQEGKRTSEIVKVGKDAQGNPISETTITSQISSTNSWTGPLEGAKFKLYKADGTTEYVPKNADGTAGTAMDIRSDANGRLFVQGASVKGIYGLDAGTYYLEEVEAPAGFIRDTTKHKIEIIPTFTNPEAKITEYTTDGETWISEEAYAALTDEQKKDYKSYTYETKILKTYTVKIDNVEAASYSFSNNGTEAEIIWNEEGPIEKPSQIVNTKGTELPSTGGIGTTIFYILGSLLVAGCGIVLISRKRMENNK